jgi:hypothetical protein
MAPSNVTMNSVAMYYKERAWEWARGRPGHLVASMNLVEAGVSTTTTITSGR